MCSKEGSSYQIHLSRNVNSSFTFRLHSSWCPVHLLCKVLWMLKICLPKFTKIPTEWGFSWEAVTMWSHKGPDNNDVLLCGSFKTRYWFQARAPISQSAQSHYGGITCRHSVNKNMAVDSPKQQTFTGRRVAKWASQRGSLSITIRHWNDP